MAVAQCLYSQVCHGQCVAHVRTSNQSCTSQGNETLPCIIECRVCEGYQHADWRANFH